MNREPPAVFVVRFIAQNVEQLRVHQRGYEIKRVVGVRDDNKQSGLSVADGVKLHFVGIHQIPDLGDVEHSQPRAA